MTYLCVIESNSSYPREYTVTTRSAYKAAQELGRCEGGETVSIYKGNTLISRVAWTPENGGMYYRCTL